MKSSERKGVSRFRDLHDQFDSLIREIVDRTPDPGIEFSHPIVELVIMHVKSRVGTSLC